MSLKNNIVEENNNNNNLFHTGCLICGSELTYSNSEVLKNCFFCGERLYTNTYCVDGHFVCDNCHNRNTDDLILNICIKSNETDASELMQKIRSNKAFPMHGPQHHSLVPAVILTVLKNSGSNISVQDIQTAIKRGKSIPGGSCAFHGACGAAIGAGVAISVLLGANPYEGNKRQIAQMATAAVLNEIASFSAARCCQRESWIALKVISEFLEKYMNLHLPVSKIICRQHFLNKECIGNNCPLWDSSETNNKNTHATLSVCPICLKQIPAERVKIGNEIFLRKSCTEHGHFESIIWRGNLDFTEWIKGEKEISVNNLKCPDNCGLCADHLQATCCVLLNITNSCNLNCRFCFADQGNIKNDPLIEDIKKSILNLTEKGKTLLQLSGGEPTIREDLPEIIRFAKDSGVKYIQLNSNGVRLGKDKNYVKVLAEAGLSFVFMQFDGTFDDIYEKLRLEKLLKIKQNAIDNCAEYNIGVTLVPTIVRGINTNNIGDITRYAISQSPKVRGVHFQPVTFIGRAPENPSDSERVTLDELIYEIQKQTGGLIKAENLLPSSCDHPLCGFHGDFMINGNDVVPLLNREQEEKKCCCNSASAEMNREFVARRWKRPPQKLDNNVDCCGDIQDMEFFLTKIKTNGFTITAMTFQDAGNIDIARLRNCSFHVYDQGRFVPFCAYYLSAWKK